MSIGPLWHGFLQIKKMLKVPILSYNVGCCTCEQSLPDSLENSRCHRNYLKSILYSLLQVLDVVDYCSINTRL